MERLEGYIAARRERCAELPDKRSGSNSRYAMADIGLSAFSVFFMQSPSFLAHQRTLAGNCGRSNAETLFGMTAIPCDNHIRQMLDGAPTAHFAPVFARIVRDLGESGGLRSLRRLDGRVLIAPGRATVLPLPPEFVRPQDGARKQDCEPMAARRWLARVGLRYAWLKLVYLGDDLYAHQPMCADVLAAGGSFIFGCKPSSHKTLAEYLAGVGLDGFSRIEGVGSARRIHRYRWMQGVPIRDGKDALIVNWLEIAIAKPNGNVTYRNSFVTDLPVTRKSAVEIAACGRARWKIENETLNVLKNNGYNLEHNFGHGKDTLASLLVVLNLLAFTMHNACDPSVAGWQQARQKLGARNRLFTHVWSISAYHLFPSWNVLMRTIVTGVPPPKTA